MFQGEVPLQPEEDYQPTEVIFVLHCVGCFMLFFFFSKRKNHFHASSFAFTYEMPFSDLNYTIIMNSLLGLMLTM